MGKVIATVLLVAATLVMIAMNIFASDGTFGDAKTQKTRAHTISDTTTVPSAQP